MKFQPGQSGNPAGRPLGARNKKTIAIEEEVAKNAEEAVAMVIRRAKGGDPTCLRLLMERVMPTGTDRPLPLELPKVKCADDAQKALDMVIEAFGRGAITVREFSPMLGSVDRMARVAERIQQNRERERERYEARRVHGIHPDMIPKVPPGWVDPDEAIKVAIERGENPWPDDPAKLAYVLEGEELFPSVNSDGTSLPRAAGEGGSPDSRERREEGETGGGGSVISDRPTVINEEERTSDHCSPITDDCSPPPGAADAAPPSPSGGGITGGLYFSVNSAEGAREEETPGEPGGGAADAPEGDALHSPVNLNDESVGASPREGTNEGDRLYPPVNSGASAGSVTSDQSTVIEEEGTFDHCSLITNHCAMLPDGSRLVAALTTAEGGRVPLYLNPQPGPDPLAEVRRMVESMASDAEPPPLNPG